MKKRNRAAKLLRLKLISLAVASCFSADLAFANPTGPVVANGQVSIIQNGNLLQITNSPNSIINWQNFSIGTNEITRFLQQSNSSAVLNRVITQNPSAILGALQSNGRVFLINPNGILFGAGAQVDVAGLVASSLNLSDTDFLAGRLRFTEVPGAGSVINQGAINAASGGQVYLVGPAVTNSGIITSPQGEVVLAAGNSVELVDAGTPNLRVEITAPDNQALNLGQIIADSGRVGIYAGLINQSGTVRANTAVVTEDGRIVLKATSNATLASGSTTTATGPLEIEADEILVAGNVTSGPQTITAGGGLLVQGTPGGLAQLAASGGQTINAGFVEVTASGGGASIDNNVSGDQLITTSGMNTSGEGLALRGGIGGFANIGQNVAGGQQVINVNNADRVTIDGAGGNALIFENSGVQTLRISGTGANALNLGSAGALGFSRLSGGTQTITAGVSGQQGSITIHGNPTGSGGPTHIASIGSQTVSTSGMLTVLGGSATAGTNTAGVFSNVLPNSTGGQIINAEGITLQGGSSGSGNGAFINANNGSQLITVGAGGITLIGGAGGANNHALLRQAPASGSQTITVNGGGITLQGGAGGTNNNAHILQVVTGVPSGSQTITVTGGGIALQGGAGGTNNGALMTGATQDISATDIVIQGGPSGSGNSAQIAANTGNQQISVGAGGITLLGGAGGTNNGAFLFGANQLITATGSVRLSGGPGSGNSSIIGSQSGVATNLLLSAGGDVVLTGGSAAGTGALIGNTGAGPLQPTNIAINAWGDVILTGGTGSGARIGSSTTATAAGGDISISAGGSIELNGSSTQAARIRTLGNVTLHADNPGGTISETTNGLIQANVLTTTSNAGTSLTGPNEMASFNATNATVGDIALVNSKNLAVMASNTAPSGKIMINNLVGDLSTSGPIAASGSGSADVALTAGGAVNLAHPVTASGTGDVTLIGGAITVDDTSVVAGGSVSVTGASLEVKGVSSGALIQAGDGFNADLSGALSVRSASVGGGIGGWAAILAGHGPVNISAGSVALEGGENLGGFAAITGGPIVATTTGDFSVAGGSGLGSFGMLLSNQNIDLTIGGSLRLISGTGFGSFARIQTLYPASTISLYFPELESGGYFVNGVEGRISQGLTGFFTGVWPARLGKTLITTYD